MPAATAPAPRRRRRWPPVLLVLATLLGTGVFVLSRLLEPERVSAFLLRQIATATGLEVRVAEPAQVGLWPDLHVALVGVEASAPGAPAPLLTAARIDAVLPWRALIDREPVVDRVRLRSPALDREAWAAWRAAVAATEVGPPEPLRIPELTASLDVGDGRLIGAPGSWELTAIELSTSPLHAGQPFSMQASAVLTQGDAQRPVELSIETVPSSDDGGLRLEPLHVEWTPVEDAPPWSMRGALTLDPAGGLRLRLGGGLQDWPQAWPALPHGMHEGPIDFTLAYDGTTDGDGSATVHLQRSDSTLDAEADVAALLAWWAEDQRALLPPLQARYAGDRLGFDGVELHGVRAQLTSDPAPGPEPAPGAADAQSAPAAAPER